MLKSKDNREKKAMEEGRVVKKKGGGRIRDE